MELLKHELYKIFSKKIVYITILFFLLVTIFLHPSANYFPKKYGSVHDFYKEYYQQYEGPVTPEKVMLAEDGNRQIAEYKKEYTEQHNGSPVDFGPKTAIHRKNVVFSEILKPIKSKES